MPVIAVINSKGGSGKSTMATHLAAWLSQQGRTVMLGDLDRQQSTRAWLKRRDTALSDIVPWALDKKNVLKVPSGVSHVVLDTPGGMHGFELAKVVMSSDAVIIPVCHSIFDRESVAACYAELQTLPRVASGRCKLGMVGMRLDARTKAADALREWAKTLNMPFLSVLREAQHYVKSLDSGLTMFDLQDNAHAIDLLQWDPILEWLSPIMKVPHLSHSAMVEPAQVVVAPAPEDSQRVNATRAASLMPAQEGLMHGNSCIPSPPPLATPTDTRPTFAPTGASVPQYLLRH